MNTNRLFGIILLAVGIGIGLIAVLWLFTNEDLEDSARILGLGIVLLVLVTPLVGGGVYLLFSGGQEAQRAQEAARQRTLLNIVQSRGQVSLTDLAVEMQIPREQIKESVMGLVGLGVFSGYINWDKDLLYSEQASQLRELQQCPNCGGAINLTGKGVASCKFCGTEFFLS